MTGVRAGALSGRRTGHRDVTFIEAAGADQDAIDNAYRSECAGRGRQYVDLMVTQTASATLRLAPR